MYGTAWHVPKAQKLPTFVVILEFLVIVKQHKAADMKFEMICICRRVSLI